MFASIKKKIAAETGKDIADLVPQLAERSVTSLHSEINNLKAAVSLLEGQNQKLLDHQESQEQIDNLKKEELSKIKHLLLIKDQEFEALKIQMLDQQQKIATLTEDNSQLQQLQDALDNLKHSTNRDLKTLSNEINRLTEEKKHLIDHVAILNNRQSQSERQSTGDGQRNELERRLEEARFELTEIKTGWSEKISNLETQVERLSKHVADEHSEKVRLSKDVDKLVEQLKQNRNEIESYQLELKNKNLKLDRLNSQIVEMAIDMQYLQDDCTTVSTKEQQSNDLTGLQLSDDEKPLLVLDSTTALNSMRLLETTNSNPLSEEQKMKLEECRKNLVILKNDLRKIGEDFKTDLNVVKSDLVSQLSTLKVDSETTINALHEVLRNKDTTIKLLRQQQINQTVPDDDDNDINFQYLRHVVLKFITSPDQETKHLIRALSAALKLSPDEQQLLQQSIDAKNSWFPSRTSFKFTPS